MNNNAEDFEEFMYDKQQEVTKIIIQFQHHRLALSLQHYNLLLL